MTFRIRPLLAIPASKVYEDNAACLKFASTGQLSPRTKHIGVPYHWFRSKVITLDIQILPVFTTDQLADIFTKCIPNPTFGSLPRLRMGW